ncbi:hypothetical protein Tco_0928394 [Tanacetum coccineum]
MIRIQNLVAVDSEYAQQVYDELIYEIESRPDVRAMKGLAEAQLQRATSDVFKSETSTKSVIRIKVYLVRVGERSEQLAELFTKVWAGTYQEGRALNVVVLHHRIIDTSQLPPLRENSTRTGLYKALTVKAKDPLMEFWPTIGDGEFVFVGGSFATFPIVLSHDPPIFKKKSLITMGIVMELAEGRCYWLSTRQVWEDDEVEEAGDEGAGGSSKAYKSMSQGDWQVPQGQWMDLQDECWEQISI